MANMNGSLSYEMVKKMRVSFESDKKNMLALNACTKVDPMEICMKRRTLELSSHVYSHKVDSEVKPMTNQKSSGRCWIFACLNLMRIPFAGHHQLDEFEFSAAYLFFWDKIERCNFFLRTIVKVFQRGEKIDGRLMSFLLDSALADGGQFDLIVNLIEKYGVVPRKCFPETFCCESSSKMHSILKDKLSEYVRDLHLMLTREVAAGEEEIDSKIHSCLEKLFQIISICLGLPPESITWEYYNKSKEYHSVGPITPLKFYKDYVKPYCNLEDKLTLVNDPREYNPYLQTYTIDCLGNMVGGRDVVFGNVHIDQLIDFTVKSIKNNEGVYFGCDMSHRAAFKQGLQDLDIYDYNLVFGTDVSLAMTKAERLIYYHSAMNHAMLFTAMSLDANGKPTKFRVENSWGEDKGDKGYVMMTADWLREFVFEVVIDKKYLPDEILEVFMRKPKVLPAWDPMGTLAS